MVNLEHDAATGRISIRFWYGGRQFKRSLKTKSQRAADTILLRVEEMLGHLERAIVLFSLIQSCTDHIHIALWSGNPRVDFF